MHMKRSPVGAKGVLGTKNPTTLQENPLTSQMRLPWTDKGYDAKALRQTLRKRGIRAPLPKRVWKTKKNRGRPIKKTVPRFQAERTFAWFQKKYRRLVVRWERIAACFEAFLAVATIHIWISRLIVG
jgi:Transposase DDE domain